MSHPPIQRLMLAGLVSAAIAGRAGAADKDEGRRLFETRIRPVLAERCYKCHSGQSKKLEGGLHLDSAGGLRRGRDSGPAVVPGKAADSLLVHALRYDGLEMPPDGKLDPEVVADFEHWVRMGAPWPEAPAEAPPSPAPPRSYNFERIRRTHCSRSVSGNSQPAPSSRCPLGFHLPPITQERNYGMRSGLLEIPTDMPHNPRSFACLPMTAALPEPLALLPNSGMPRGFRGRIGSLAISATGYMAFPFPAMSGFPPRSRFQE